MVGKVLVIGATNVDLVVHCAQLPKAGETVVGPQVQQFGGGKGANAAIAAARAGAEVRFCSAVGGDGFGQSACLELSNEGIETLDVSKLDDIATGTALIVVDAKGENQIAVGAGANARVSEQMVVAALTRAKLWADVVLISTEIPGPAIAAAARTAADLGLTLILNPAPVVAQIADLLVCRPILTPNASELRDLYQLLNSRNCELSVAEMAQFISQRAQSPVIVTLGAQGVLVCAPDAPAQTLKAPHVVDVQDTTGAGDTFNGVLAEGLAQGLSLHDAAARAVIAASLSVRAIGARSGMPTATEIAAHS